MGRPVALGLSLLLKVHPALVVVLGAVVVVDVVVGVVGARLVEGAEIH